MLDGTLRESALTTIDAFVAVLDSEDLSGWANRFRAIHVALKNGDDKTALELHESISYTGIGSLSDIYAKN